MANADHLCKGRIILISYKRATFIVCACNVVVMLFMMYTILSPLHLRSTSLPQLVMAVGPFNQKQTNTKEDMERLKVSYKLRRALMPVHLIEEVKELQAETEIDIKRTKIISAARQKHSIEVSQRLAQVKQNNIQSNQQGLQKWRKKKLQSAKRHEVQRPK
ncbi:hypothetical protein KC19_6G108800 [Ceratodon purpureus]|uniref:Uncharacterized protein n=1 Tax=Ceratodon purpureus TaxID=3225 RepID=A0A8T0HD08_CERPU|nr:hypothetical protein KC19_6G108800 [Ceratodon purpureus]